MHPCLKVTKWNCLGILWKTIKFFINDKDGVEVISPKKSIKEFHNLGYIDYDLYENVMKMIDDRNSLSHIYKEDMFEDILIRLPEYLKGMKKVFNLLSQSIKD